MCMHKKITISIPEEVLRRLDTAAKVDSLTRSAYIREAVALKHELDTIVENEVTDRNSYINVVRRMHYRRMSNRQIREMGPLNWAQSQD